MYGTLVPAALGVTVQFEVTCQCFFDFLSGMTESQRTHMSQKQIEVACPCCESRLVIDVLTSKILRHVPPEKLDETGKPVLDGERWATATKRIQDKTKRGGDSFDAAMNREQRREGDLDDLFDKAKDKLKRRADEADGLL